MEELNSIPYLDYVVREVLRYHSVVSGTVRVASQDDIVPLDMPFSDKYGKVHDRIQYVICITPLSPLTRYSVKKGDAFVIPIRLLNTLDTIWGPDALEFKSVSYLLPTKP